LAAEIWCRRAAVAAAGSPRPEGRVPDGVGDVRSRMVLKDFLLNPKVSRCSPGTVNFSITVRVHTFALTRRQHAHASSDPHMDGLPAN